MIGSLKKLSRNAFLPIVALSLVAQVSAAGNDEGNMVYGVYALKNKQQFVFAYHNDKDEAASVLIRNANGEVIHSETVRTHTIQKIYDLSEYGYGRYTVEVVGASGEKSVREIVLKPTATVQPQVSATNPNHVQVRMDNAQGENVYVVIVDSEGNAVFDEQVSTPQYRRVFNLEKLPTGEYKIKFVGQQQVIQEVVVKK